MLLHDAFADADADVNTFEAGFALRVFGIFSRATLLPRYAAMPGCCHFG